MPVNGGKAQVSCDDPFLSIHFFQNFFQDIELNEFKVIY